MTLELLKGHQYKQNDKPEVARDNRVKCKIKKNQYFKLNQNRKDGKKLLYIATDNSKFNKFRQN